MRKYIIVLPDGSQITSGTPETPAIMNVTVTRSVDTEENLTLGAVCPAMLEAEILTTRGALGIGAGEELTLLIENSDGSRQQQGIFIAEKPELIRQNRYRLTAYDRVVRLDRDLTGWLKALNGWPYDLRTFAQMVCTQCGVALEQGKLPNGSYQIRKFAAENVTGRQLLKMAAELAGRFCTARADGVLTLGWYTPYPFQLTPGAGSIQLAVADDTLQLQTRYVSCACSEEELSLSSALLEHTDDGQGNVQLTVKQNDRHFYYTGNLQLADYQVQPVEKVHLKMTADDVGTVYPDVEEGNTYTVSENYLLTGSSTEEHKGVAETLYRQLQSVTYTPCTLQLQAGTGICPGHILQVLDSRGALYSIYVMQQKQTGQKDTLICKGAYTRDSVTTVNNATFAALSGKVLTLRKDMDGLQLENIQEKEKTAKLSLTVDGIYAQVQQTESRAENTLQRMSALEQTAQQLSIQIQSVQTGGVDRVKTSTGYIFSEDGLYISKDGEEIENQLDNTGMYVRRSGENILQANSKGVVAADVTVQNYLVAGAHARFESYGESGTQERTACFYV